MARLSSIALFIAMNVLICVFAEEELYTDRYDYLDASEILKNDTLREHYYNCFMDKTKCTSPAQITLTEIFSEAYQTRCKKCTKKQIKNFDTVAEWYSKNEPDKWQLIVAKTVENLKKKNAGQ